MLFNSFEYLFVFLPIVFIIYFLLNKFKLFNSAKVFLLLSSLFFYGSYKLDYVLIIISSIILNYSIYLFIKKDVPQNKKKIVLIFGILCNILILIFFKYFNYLSEIVSEFFNNDFEIAKIIIPIGINFFTLQQISFIVDTYKKKTKDYNFIDYSLFICFFPQLLAGPIVRINEIVPQFNNLKYRLINQQNIFVAIFLISIGLFKKTVLSDGYSMFVDCTISPEYYKNIYYAWLLGFAKIVRFYFDFSGYCDIALGSAFLFNIKLPRNFNSPFQAKSIIDYWKRTNMTLIRFLKDYVFIPLQKEKDNTTETMRNIMIVFSLLGLWVGANAVNILSGIFSGIFVCINYLTINKLSINRFVSKCLLFVYLITFGQFLYTKNVNMVFDTIKAMFGIGAKHTFPLIQDFNLIVYPQPAIMVKMNLFLLIFSFILLYFCKNSNILAKIYSKANNPFYTVLVAIFFVIAILCITRTSDFVYFIF